MLFNVCKHFAILCVLLGAQPAASLSPEKDQAAANTVVRESGPPAPGSASAPAAPLGRIFGSHQRIALSQTDQVPESSGVVASTRTPHVYWTHNDSGPPRVYAFRLAPEDRAAHFAKHLACIELVGARAVDWEDISTGPGGLVYILDGGDNECGRRDKSIIRFAEPAIDPAASPVVSRVPCEALRFEYPDPRRPQQPAGRDHRYDAETLFVHPATGDIYIVTKRDPRNVPTARVYKLPAANLEWRAAGDSPRQYLLEFVADLSARIPGMVTGGDIDVSGRRLVIRNYITAYEFELPAGQPFEKIFEATPRSVLLLGEPQGEGICYSRDGSELITTSEVVLSRSKQFPIYAARPPLRESK